MAADAGHQAAEQEGDQDDAVLVDAHQRGGVRVLRDGPDAPAEPGAFDELVEDEHHEHDGRDDDEESIVG